MAVPSGSVQVVTDDGVVLEVVERGEGPVLLLLHGFGGAKEDFADHLDSLARTHRVVAYDHRGHGASGKPEGPGAYSLARLARDVLAVADALGARRFRLVGHSMGGMVAQEVVLREPERVEALVLMETWPGAPPVASPEEGRRAAEIALGAGMAELHRLMGERDVLATPAHERVLRERPGYRAFNDRKFLAQSPHMYAALLTEMLERADCSDALATVACPTLVVVGEQDEAAVPGCTRLATAIPGARLVTLEEAGHSPQFEAPERWRAAVTGFLEGLDR